MPGIVCAIRGGPSSQPTIATSIQLAQETGETIHFLYIVNLDFLSRSSSSKTNHITQEMVEMGEFILLGAQEQATNKNVSAEGIIREGAVADEIVSYCEEVNPTHVVLGRPQEEQKDNLLTNERLKAFIDQISEVCQASIILSS